MRVMFNHFGYPISLTHFTRRECFYVDLMWPETTKHT